MKKSIVIKKNSSGFKTCILSLGLLIIGLTNVSAQLGNHTVKQNSYMPSYDRSLEALAVEDFDQYKALYDALDSSIGEGDMDEELDHFELNFPGYRSFRSDFNDQHDWVNGSFTDEQLTAIYEQDYIADEIDKTLYNNYSEIIIGDYVYVDFALNIKFKILKTDITSIMQLRQYPKGGDLPQGVLSNENIELISSTNVLTRGQVTISDELRYESVSTVSAGFCDSYKKGLRVALEQHTKSDIEGCEPFCWSEALYIADTIVIDWGDGTPSITLTGLSNDNLNHTYVTSGSYNVTVTYTFTDSEGDAQTLTDNVSTYVGGAACGSVAEWSVQEERIEGNTKMISKLWYKDHGGWAYHAIKAFTHSWRQQTDGTWKRKREELYVKIDNSTFRNVDCGFMQTITADKHRNNRKRVQKTKEINEAGYGRVRASNDEVKSYHYLRKSGLHITDWCIHVPCPETDPEDPCEIAAEPINYDPKSQIMPDGSVVHTYPTLTGDIDADGDEDIIFVGQNWSGAGLNIRTKISNGDGTYTPVMDIQGDGSGVHTYPTLVGDMNNDGRDDLVFIGQNWSGAGLNIRTKLSNGDGTYTHYSDIQGDGPGVHDYPAMIGDMNGDGRDDLIFIGQNWSGTGLNIRTKISNGDGSYTHYSDIQGDGSAVHAFPAMIGDMNGDDKDDVVFIGQNWNGAGLNIRTKISNGDGTYTHYSDVQGDGSAVHTYPALIGDVNGDNSDDLVFVGQNWSGVGLNIRTKFSNGDGTYEHVSNIQGDGSGVHTYPTLTGDFNGDCKMDLVFVGNGWDCTGGLQIRTKLSAGDGSWVHNSELHPDGSGVHTYPALAADITGDQNTDIVFIGQNWSGPGLNIRSKVSEFTSSGCFDCTDGAVADASFVNTQGNITMPSYYGPQEVTKMCRTNNIIIDGSTSECENGYFIEIAEFDLASWTIVGTPLYSSWVCAGCFVPNNINITDYVPLASFDNSKVYKFKLAVGTPWNETNKFFRLVSNCVLVGVSDDKFERTVEGTLSQDEEITIYPNPTKNTVFIDTRMYNEETTLQVYTMLGNKIGEQKLISSTKDNVLDMSGKPLGVYLFTITNKKGAVVKTSRVIKQ